MNSITIWIVGLLVGLATFLVTKQRIAKWRRIPARLALLAFGILGFVPAMVMKLGAVETTSWGVTIAIVYFLVFSVFAGVLLNGIVARAEQRK